MSQFVVSLKNVRQAKGLQDACILSICVSFAVIVVRVDLVGEGDFQSAATL